MIKKLKIMITKCYIVYNYQRDNDPPYHVSKFTEGVFEKIEDAREFALNRAEIITRQSEYMKQVNPDNISYQSKITDSTGNFCIQACNYYAHIQEK
jgi:hypothetical protein